MLWSAFLDFGLCGAISENLVSLRKGALATSAHFPFFSYIMKRPNENNRESRIIDEIVVDAYGEQERAMGWYYLRRRKDHFSIQVLLLHQTRKLSSNKHRESSAKSWLRTAHIRDTAPPASAPRRISASPGYPPQLLRTHPFSTTSALRRRLRSPRK